jgi:hypothetical protein
MKKKVKLFLIQTRRILPTRNKQVAIQSTNLSRKENLNIHYLLRQVHPSTQPLKSTKLFATSKYYI